MNIALLVWNILLTAGLIYLAWRQFTFEKMVSRFTKQLVELIQRDSEKMIRLSKASLVILGFTFLLTVFKKFKGDANESV